MKDNTLFGKLYIVATPIGNLEDITFRAVKILKNVDLIAAENTTHSKALCRYYGIDTRLISYNQHNRKNREPEILKIIEKGSDVALISSAGTPGISDPGALLIKSAVNVGIRVSPIPGPSAAITALSVSGLNTDEFTFVGFLSNKSGKRKKELRGLISEPRTMVFYEAPHRIRAMLEDIREILGDRNMVLFRELTKLFEEILRGTVNSILKDLDEERIKGEFTLVVEGKKEKDDEFFFESDFKKHIKDLLKEDRLTIKDIAMLLSSITGIPYRKIYREAVKLSDKV